MVVISCCCALNILVFDKRKEYELKLCIYKPGAGSPHAICSFTYCSHIAVTIPSCLMSGSFTSTSAHSASSSSFLTLPPIGSSPSPSPSPSSSSGSWQWVKLWMVASAAGIHAWMSKLYSGARCKIWYFHFKNSLNHVACWGTMEIHQFFFCVWPEDTS